MSEFNDDLIEHPLVEEKHDDIITISQDSEKKSSYPLLFILLGNSGLLFFNLVINAIDIYIIVTKDNLIGTRLSQAYNIPCSTMALILCFFKPRNLKVIIILSSLVLIALLCVLPMFLLLNCSSEVTFYCTLSIAGVCGVASQALFASSFSLASQFGGSSVGYVSNGNGLCGVLAAVLRVITKAAFMKESQLKISSAAYFFFGAGLILLSLIVFIYHLIKKNEVHEACTITNVEKPPSIFSRHTIDVIKVIWPLWLAQFANFLITLTLFPGYVSSTHQTEKLGDWTPLFVTGIFCIFDWIGRSAPNWKIWPAERYSWIPIALRLLFFPIFILTLQNVIKNVEPMWTFLWDIVFALSNGYFGTVVMIYGNSQGSLNNDDKKFAAFLMSFAINAGIFLAMFLALALPTPKV